MKRKLFASATVAALNFLFYAQKAIAFQVGTVSAKTYEPGQIISTGIVWAGAGAGLAGLAFLIFAGIKYITAAGEPTKVEAAQKQIVSAIIGLAIVILSYTLVRFVFFLLSAEFGLGEFSPLTPIIQ